MDIREASGNIQRTDKLVFFLLLLLYGGYIRPSDIEEVMEQMDKPYLFSNNQLIRYAMNVASRLQS